MAGERGTPKKWHGPVLMLLGLVLAWYGLRTLGASYAITRWPVVPARVILSTIEPGSNGRYRPRVEYELYLAGQRYVGGGIFRPAEAGRTSGPLLLRERAESVVTRYPVGSELLAGYDPVNPSRTVLKPGFNWWTLVPVAMGGLLVYAGFRLWRRDRVVEQPAAA